MKFCTENKKFNLKITFNHSSELRDGASGGTFEAIQEKTGSKTMHALCLGKRV